MAEKKYPFSTQKNAHSIEFRRNRVYCIMRDMQDGEIEWDEQKYDSLEKLHDELTELLEAVLNSSDGRICYLTGKQIGLAKECVAWASNARTESLIDAGKIEYLKYC